MKNIIRRIEYGRPIATTFLAELKLTDNNKPTNVIENKDKIIPCRALIDTGATISVISKKIIEDLKLKPISETIVGSVSHNNQKTNIYTVHMGIAVNERIVPTAQGLRQNAEIIWFPISVVAGEAIHEQGIDCIIGMNVIMEGHLSIAAGHFIFSI